MIVPNIFQQVPSSFLRINDPVSVQELASAVEIRKRYELDEWQNPYLVDVIRTFRLVESASTYIEVGTRDKGNLAWIAPKLSRGAVMIDVDIDRFDSSEARLRQDLHETSYHRVTGNSISDDTLAEVRRCLNGRPADAIFCDSSHMYDHTLAEFDRYFPLLKRGGVLLFHDCFWEGNATDKGKAQAMSAIDRFVPVYCVFMEEPVKRFVPRSDKGDVWGGLSIIVKD